MTYEIRETCSGCGSCISICPVKAISGSPNKLHYINKDFCIGCGACARVCMNSCVFDLDGNTLPRESKKNWLVPHFSEKLCHRCGKCYEMCPAGIITKPTISKLQSLTNSKLCASCHWCEKVCVYGGISFAVAATEGEQS